MTRRIGSSGRFNTIRGRLFLLLAIVLVPTLFVQVLIYNDRYKTARAAELRANMEVARGMCMAFEQFVEDVFHQEQAIGLALASGRLTRGNIQTILEQGANEHPSVLSFAWVDSRGRIAHSSFKRDEGIDLSAHPFFLEMRAGGIFHVSDLFILQGSQKPIFTVSRSFRHQSGELLGTVVAVVDPGLLSITLAFEREGAGAVGLLDRNGRLVFRHPDLDLTWEERSWSKRPYIEDALKGREFVHRAVGTDGRERLYAFTPVDSIGWVAGASRPEAEVVSAIYGGLLRHAGMSLMVILLSIPLAAGVAYTISRPVRYLRERAVRKQGGENGFDEFPGGPIELRELAAALKQMTGELRQNEQELRATLESIGDGFFALNSGWRFIYANPSAEQLAGIRSEEVVGRSYWEVFPLVPGTRLEREFTLAAAGQIRDFDFYCESWGRWFSYRCFPREGGGISVYFQDITERKRTADALRESEERLRLFIEYAPSSLAMFDRKMRYLYVSRRWRAEYHLAERTLEGVSHYEIFPEIPEYWREAHRQGLAGKVLQSEGERFERLDGSVQWVKWEIRPWYDAAGMVGGIVVFTEDITESKQVEEKLRSFANELEKRVRERTAELERANQAKATFLANMSHEIRTPVGEVIGMTEMLMQQDLPLPVRKDLETIRRSTDTILLLLNDLLDLTRIEQGKLKLDIRRCRIRELIGSVFSQHQPRAAEKGIGLELTFGRDVPDQLNCDAERIAQVIKNLLSNALKFTETGSVRVKVDLDKESDRKRLRISVSDTGIGIPEEQQGQLFHSFTQLDPSYSKRFAGAGLGLAISKQLVELMGGEITVRSKPGKGSTFSFTVGYGEAESGAAEDSDRLGLGDLPSIGILLAEDNPVNRLFLNRALTGAGHRVEEATNGKEVLEKNVGQRFDLILMDIQMPEMDGVEATRRIRSGGHGRTDIPIIALTAYAMKGDRERFMAEGMNGYVTKPVDFGELANEIAQAFNSGGEQTD